MTEFGQLRSTLQAAARKQGGSLAVRDVSSLVPPSQLVYTENLTTLLVVVPKSAKGDWLAQYESLSEFVVPRSTSVVAEDQDYQAFTVVLFRRVVDNFKTAARGKGFQVRRRGASLRLRAGAPRHPARVLRRSTAHRTRLCWPISHALCNPCTTPACAYEPRRPRHPREQVKDLKVDPEAARSSEAELARVRTEVEQRRVSLEQWCITSYGEAFSSWIHVCAVRLFVESILRYGLPPKVRQVPGRSPVGPVGPHVGPGTQLAQHACWITAGAQHAC